MIIKQGVRQVMEWIILALIIGFVLGFFSGLFTERRNNKGRIASLRKQMELDAMEMIKELSNEPDGL